MLDDKIRSHEGESMYETVRGAMAGDDEPMEDGHPNATGVLVAGAYPIALLVIVLVGLAVAYFNYSDKENFTSPTTQSASVIE